jgi:hypothetical protein
VGRHYGHAAVVGRRGHRHPAWWRSFLAKQPGYPAKSRRAAPLRRARRALSGRKHERRKREARMARLDRLQCPRCDTGIAGDPDQRHVAAKPCVGKATRPSPPTASLNRMLRALHRAFRLLCALRSPPSTRGCSPAPISSTGRVDGTVRKTRISAAVYTVDPETVSWTC